MKIIADNKIPFLEGVFERYGVQVTYLDGHSICADDVRDADAMMIRTRTKCDAPLLDGSSVSLIATATIGFDHIDKLYCNDNNIEVVTAAGCNARAVAQYVMAALVALDIRPGARLGVVGVGNVGEVVCRVAKSLGYNVLMNDPPRQTRGEMVDFGDNIGLENRSVLLDFNSFKSAKIIETKVHADLHDSPDFNDLSNSKQANIAKINDCSNLTKSPDFTGFYRDEKLEFTELEELMRVADVVTFHVPLDNSTRDMISPKLLSLMKPSSVIINSSRGEIMDEVALADCLVKGKVAHAVLDVWRNEPDINLLLMSRATIATPHIAGYSRQGKAMGTAMVVRAIAHKFGIRQLLDWYPTQQVTPTEPRDKISWIELEEGLKANYDIISDSLALKNAPQDFERLRGRYNYRNEFF